MVCLRLTCGSRRRNGAHFRVSRTQIVWFGVVSEHCPGDQVADHIGGDARLRGELGSQRDSLSGWVSWVSTGCWPCRSGVAAERRALRRPVPAVPGPGRTLGVVRPRRATGVPPIRAAPGTAGRRRYRLLALHVGHARGLEPGGLRRRGPASASSSPAITSLTQGSTSCGGPDPGPRAGGWHDRVTQAIRDRLADPNAQSACYRGRNRGAPVGVEEVCDHICGARRARRSSWRPARPWRWRAAPLRIPRRDR